jgi:hypothetical protein
MPRSALLLAAVVALTASVAGKPQRPAGDAPFQTVRGQVVSGDLAAAPLRRVRIALSGANVIADPSYTDERGRFELAVPAAAKYSLTFTKAGFAPQNVDRDGAASAGDLHIRLARGGVVTGRVVDQFDDPMLGTVRIRRATEAPGSPSAPDEWSAPTDDRGEFRVGSLPAGRHQITVEPANAPGGMPAPAVAPPPTVIQLGAGEEASVNFIVRAEATDPRGTVIGGARTPVVANGATIRGQVTRADGRPVAGAFLMLVAGAEGTRQTVSAADGTYEFARLPAGAYRLNASKVSAAFASVDRNVTVRQGQLLEAVTLTVTTPSAVGGAVLDEFGEPVEGVTVELLQPIRRDGRRMLQRAGDVRPRRTDDRGQYRLFPVRTGEHYVLAGEEARVVGGITAVGPDRSLRVYYPGTPIVTEAATVRVVAGQDTVGVDITLRPTEGARVNGYAFDSSGKPLQFPVTMMESSRSGGPLTARRQAVVSKDGAFAFLNVPPGEYVIQGIVPPSPGRSTEFGVGFVTVGGAEMPPLIIRTSRGTTVKGRVVLEGDRSKVEFESFGIGANTSDPDYAVVGADSPGDGVAEDGTFEMHLHGPMRIASRVNPQGWWLKSAMIGVVDASDQPYTFSGEGETTIEVIFSDTAASVSGRVIGSGGEPASGAFLVILPADESRRYINSPYVTFRRLTDGSYRIDSLPPGDYLIVAVDRFDLGNERQDPDAWHGLAPLAQRITLNERQRATRDLQVVRRPGM